MDLKDTNAYELYWSMEKYYCKEKHDKFINKFRNYIEIPGVGINKLMLFKYVYALIDTDQVEVALRILNIIFKDKKFLESDQISNRKLYLIGRMLYDKEYYSEAKEVLKKYLELVNDGDYKYYKSVQRLLVEIKRHEEGYFNKIYAEQYLKNKNLEPGLIVFLKFNTKLSTCDRKNVHKRPYLIWKVEGNIVYAFPITAINTSRINDINISKDDTPKFLETEIVIFNKFDIETIYRKLNPEFLNEILEKQYYRYCHSYEKNDFVLDYEKKFNINLFDVIVVSDNNNLQKSYIITDIDSNKQLYKVREVIAEDTKYIGLSSNEETISFDEFVYTRITFKNFFNLNKNNLFNENDFERYLYITNDSLMQIQYKGLNYIVLELIDGFYVCICEEAKSNEKLIYISEFEDIKFLKLININIVKERMKRIIVNDLIKKSETLKLERK
ncbi:MAG: hypothetical protein E7163_05205 [Firmicutes bacterium]|nr:hypothetical protein [Bacillota bacterium]